MPPPTVTYSISVSHHLRLREIKSKQHNPSDDLSDVKTEQSFSNPLHSILPTMEESTALCEGEPLQYYSLENQHGSEAHTHGEILKIWDRSGTLYLSSLLGRGLCLYISNSYLPSHSSCLPCPLNIQFKLNIWSLAVGFHWTRI